MNIPRSYHSIEARSAAALRFKVLSKKALGWAADGPALLVTAYRKGNRAITRYSQGMFKPEPTPPQWEFAH